MAKAVLITKLDPTYDDRPDERYHFPRTYLRQVEAAAGDWIVYYEPRRASGDPSSRGGRQAYFATARIERIVEDAGRPDHFYALMAPGSYLEFDRAVPFREGSHYYESALRRPDGGTSKGAFGRAVRIVPDTEFDLIVKTGFARTIRETAPVSDRDARVPEFAEPPAPFERPIVESIVRRPFREAAFASAVKNAYLDTCAMTGIKIVNGGGRTEVQAAHIQPVHKSGPDAVSNGIALCGTVHWMFDRGLLSIADDHRILVAEAHVPPPVRRLLNPSGRLIVPDRPELQPHPAFLRYHQGTFKG